MKTKNQKLLEDINRAFASNDSDYILHQVTEDIHWDIVGDQTVNGKEAFANTLKAMQQDQPMELTIYNIITHGKSAAVNGKMKSAEGKTYAFCDVYKFSGFKNPKICKMTSYALEVKA